MIFDPFGWAARYMHPGSIHRCIRYAGAALFTLFLIRRVGQYDEFASKPLWAVETVVYAALLSAFLVRATPIDRSTGWREVGVPLLGALLPFALLTSPPHRSLVDHPAALFAVFWWMTLGTALTAWGIWTLRRSFSITVEARALIARGPYRWVRHPIYSGEILSAAAVTAWRFSWLNVALLALFTAIQLARARWEERKLSRHFPEYAAGKAWWLWSL